MMSSAAAGEPRRHPAEAELLAFLSRKDQSSSYVLRSADWIKTEYPGSVPVLIPKMRQLYRDKRREGQ